MNARITVYAFVALLAMAVPPTQAATVLSCGFTAANGTDIDAYTCGTDLVGNTWSHQEIKAGSTPVADAVEVQGNRLNIDTSLQGGIYDLTVADYTLAFNFVVGAGSSQYARIPIRFSDSDNHYWINLRPVANDVSIYKVDGGTQTVCDTASWTLNLSTTYAVTIEVSGTSAVLKIGGSTAASCTMDTVLTATKFGLGTATIGSAVEYDALVVTATLPAQTISYDAATYDPGDTFVATLTGWSTAPTAFVNQSTGNDSYSTTGTCNTSTCSGVLPNLADLVSGGAGEHTQLNVSLTVRGQSGSESADASLSINPPAVGDFIAAIACNSASCPNDSVLKLNFAAAAVGDDLYCYSPFGGATVTDYGVPSWVTSPAQLKCRLFDESANAWTAETTDDFTEEVEATCAKLVRDAWRATIKDLAKEPICRNTLR